MYLLCFVTFLTNNSSSIQQQKFILLHSVASNPVLGWLPPTGSRAHYFSQLFQCVLAVLVFVEQLAWPCPPFSLSLSCVLLIALLKVFRTYMYNTRWYQVDTVGFVLQVSSQLYILEVKDRMSVVATTQATIDGFYSIALGESNNYVNINYCLTKLLIFGLYDNYGYIPSNLWNIVFTDVYFNSVNELSIWVYGDFRCCVILIGKKKCPNLLQDHAEYAALYMGQNYEWFRRLLSFLLTSNLYIWKHL